MDLERRIRRATGLTPTEQHLANAVIAMGDRLQTCSIKEFASMASCSIATVHRLCRKLGLEGFKQLKIEIARSFASRAHETGDIDVDFPFDATSGAEQIAKRMDALYVATLEDTRELLDPVAVEQTARLINGATCVDIYTQSHNLYPAQMFCERLLSAGKAASCHGSFERQIRGALASDARHTAIAISYSGLAPHLKTLLGILSERQVPVTLIGTDAAIRRHPGLTCYLSVSDRESLRHRITQFASHIAVQYVLDTLYACFFASDYERSFAFLERSLPYTRLPQDCGR